MIDLTQTPKRLKQAILQKAMQGKLTKQLPSDGNASDLLDKIEQQKQRLIKFDKLRRHKKLAPINKDEIPFKIPKNWKWVKFGNLASVLEVATVPKREYKSSGVPFYKIGDIVSLSKGNNVTNNAFISKNLYLKNTRKKGTVSKGDILLTATGTLGVSWIVPNNKIFYFQGSNNILWIKNIYKLYSSFINLIFKTNLFHEQLSSISNGSTLKHISIALLSNILIPLPPLPEQKRIIKRLDQILPKIDKLNNSVVKLHQLHQSFPHRMKQSLLQAAMQGKLTKQLPSDGNAEDLLKKIKQRKQQLVEMGKIRKRKPLPPINKKDVPFEIPKNWKWVHLNDISDVRDGTHGTPKYVSHGIPLITSKNIINHKINFDNVKFITPSDAKEINSRSKVNLNDIIMAMIGTVGNLAINNTNKTFSIKNVALIKDNRFINIKFVYYYILYDLPRIKNKASGAVQSFISLKKIRKLNISVPPLSEQKRIVNKLDTLFSKISD